MKFSNWKSWKTRTSTMFDKLPGVYCIALSINEDLTDKEHGVIEEIIYIGQSTSVGNRLYQFDRAIQGKEGHSGGNKFFDKYGKEGYDRTDNMYVAAKIFEGCDPDSNKKKNILQLLEMHKLEFEVIGQYINSFDKLPKYNDL